MLVLGFLVLLPFILWAAFEFGTSNNARRSGGFVDLATASAPNFVVFTLFASGTFLLPVIVALFFGDTVASEASWSSLKYLLAMPIPRHRLMRQKVLTSGLLSLLAITLLPAVALLVGVIFYGTGEAVSPTGDAISFGDSMIALVLTICYLAIHLAWMACRARRCSARWCGPGWRWSRPGRAAGWRTRSCNWLGRRRNERRVHCGRT